MLVGWSFEQFKHVCQFYSDLTDSGAKRAHSDVGQFARVRCFGAWNDCMLCRQPATAMSPAAPTGTTLSSVAILHSNSPLLPPLFPVPAVCSWFPPLPHSHYLTSSRPLRQAGRRASAAGGRRARAPLVWCHGIHPRLLAVPLFQLVWKGCFIKSNHLWTPAILLPAFPASNSPCG